jgi:hypothetical protein
MRSFRGRLTEKKTQKYGKDIGDTLDIKENFEKKNKDKRKESFNDYNNNKQGGVGGYNMSMLNKNTPRSGNIYGVTNPGNVGLNVCKDMLMSDGFGSAKPVLEKSGTIEIGNETDTLKGLDNINITPNLGAMNMSSDIYLYGKGEKETMNLEIKMPDAKKAKP